MCVPEHPQFWTCFVNQLIPSVAKATIHGTTHELRCNGQPGWCMVSNNNGRIATILRDCIKNEISPLSADERAVIENGLKKYILKIKT